MSTATSGVAAPTVRTRLAHVLRGALIGAAEAVPGISGGTIALVTGVFEDVISSAGHLVSGLRALLTDRARARAELRAVQWGLLLPLLAGMVPALLMALLLLAPMIERYPVPMRGLLFGMVAAALIVPITMVGRWRWRELLLAAVAVGVGFLATGQLRLSLEPSLPVVFVAAAVAVCALVLPGISGAFLLLAFGLYQPTRDAVRDLNFAYIGVFVLGAASGLAGFVKALQWLLAHWHRATLAVMTGLVVGALRALWPWQTDEHELLAPGEQLGLVVLLCLLGAGVVLGIVLLERRFQRRAVAGAAAAGAGPLPAALHRSEPSA